MLMPESDDSKHNSWDAIAAIADKSGVGADANPTKFAAAAAIAGSARVAVGRVQRESRIITTDTLTDRMVDNTRGEVDEVEHRLTRQAVAVPPADLDAEKPLRAPIDADLDTCIRDSASGAGDGKTSDRQLRKDAPQWFSDRGLRSVTQADMYLRLRENNANLLRPVGQRRN